MLYKLIVAGFLGVASGAKTFGGCNPGGPVPCDTPVPALPVVWDNAPQDEPAIKHGNFNLNPYNSIRPEYRDAPPSQADLEKIWQHHLKDHNFKSPFVRPMKSGLWEAGVPNRYAPSGYNRRKFKTEEEALAYVRHKTGAGSNIDYQGALKSEAEVKGAQLTDQPVVFEKGKHATVRRTSLLEVAAKPAKDDIMANEEIEYEGSFLEMGSTQPTKDMDVQEAAASVRDLAEDDKVLDDEETHTRATRDHNLKIAHKMRDFLGNYRPDHKVEVLHPGFVSR